MSGLKTTTTVRVDLCAGCSDNQGEDDHDVHCAAAGCWVTRVIFNIEPGDKNRDKHCPRRQKKAA